MLKHSGNPARAGRYLLSAVMVWGGMTLSVHAKSPMVRSGARNVGPAKGGTEVKQSKGTPREINYQGWLGDKGDTTGVTGNLDMTFRLYDDSTAGSVLWNETQSAVTVDKGVFNVLLGSQTSIPSNIFTGDPLWLETQVESDTLSPRKKLVSVGYAIRSVYADTAGYARDSDKVDGYDGSDLVGPRSIDGVSNNGGDIDLIAGGNIAITPNDLANTIIISSTTDSVAYADTAGYASKADTANYALSGVGANGWTLVGNDMYSAVSGNVGVGVSGPTEKLDIDGAVNTSSLYKIGGDKVLSNPGVGNIFVGVGAGENTTGNYNTFFGSNAGNSNISGLANTFLGCTAGYANIGGYRNTFLGIGAGGTNTAGHENTLLGSWAGYSNAEGNNNVFVGFRAGYYETGSNKLYIANDSTDTDVLIYGEFDNRRVGIGTTSPTANLDVNGVDGYNQLRMRVSFTPDSTGDARGNTGDIAWDDDCIYIRTSGGWKKAALSIF